MSAIALPHPALWNLPSGPEAAARARHLAHDWLVSWAPDAKDATADACLAVSELAANAAAHGKAPVTLAMSTEPRGDCAVVLTVVHDRGAQLPQVIVADPLEERHRGLLLVDAVTDRWGVRDAADGGKDVWFEVTLPVGVRAGAASRIPSFPERNIAARARRAPASYAERPLRGLDTIQPRLPWHLSAQRVPYRLTSRAEALLDSTGFGPGEDY